MVTIIPALEQVRKDLTKLLSREAVEQACREANYKWRKRRLDPTTTIHLFLLQVLNQNTAMTHLPRLLWRATILKRCAKHTRAQS